MTYPNVVEAIALITAVVLLPVVLLLGLGWARLRVIRRELESTGWTVGAGRFTWNSIRGLYSVPAERSGRRMVLVPVSAKACWIAVAHVVPNGLILLLLVRLWWQRGPSMDLESQIMLGVLWWACVVYVVGVSAKRVSSNWSAAEAGGVFGWVTVLGGRTGDMAPEATTPRTTDGSRGSKPDDSPRGEGTVQRSALRPWMESGEEAESRPTQAAPAERIEEEEVAVGLPFWLRALDVGRLVDRAAGVPDDLHLPESTK